MSSINDDYFDLGSYSRPISTSSKEAQRWFDRGLVWAYSFNHNEAVKCFETAVSYDPACAMAHWGVAFASGPNYNKAWQLFDHADLVASVHKTYDASRRAMELIGNASPFERSLIEATQHRYEREHNVDWDQYNARNTAYADTMRPFYESFPDDLDACTLYADAMMNMTPWQLWDLDTGQPGEGTRTWESKAVLEHGLSLPGARYHPGILHMYIHCIEMSPWPERGLNAADDLRSLVPDGGHLQHMPSHLDVLVGDYRRAMASNYSATIADEKFVARHGAMNFYSFYRMHNYHSLIYSAMFSGKKSTALETLDRMEATLPIDVLRVDSPPLADWLETYFAVRPHVMVQFGMWDELLTLPLPPSKDQDLLCVTTATIHYAKGIAASALGNIPQAEDHRRLFQAACRRVPASRKTFPNSCIDILAVGEAMLNGELSYRKGQYEAAFAQLREAIARSDALIYSEPWGWMQPVRHAYAALLLEQGRVEEAAESYCDDLGLGGTLPRAHQHPNNVWALTGYYECLVKLGREKEARLLETSLNIARAVADVDVEYSCFCSGRGVVR